MGKTTELIIGLNCIVQRAELKISEKNKRAAIISRPAQNLYLLEMKDKSISLSNQRSRTNKGKTYKSSELSKKHENNEQHKQENGGDNSYQFSWSANDLGRECKDPFSNSSGWNGTNLRVNKETNNHGGSEQAPGKDGD